jgi:hypothetical protein
LMVIVSASSLLSHRQWPGSPSSKDESRRQFLRPVCMSWNCRSKIPHHRTEWRGRLGRIRGCLKGSNKICPSLLIFGEPSDSHCL